MCGAQQQPVLDQLLVHPKRSETTLPWRASLDVAPAQLVSRLRLGFLGSFVRLVPGGLDRPSPVLERASFSIPIVTRTLLIPDAQGVSSESLSYEAWLLHHLRLC